MDALSGLIVILVVLIVLFLIFRAIVLWYWKVDEQVALLKDLRDELRGIRAAMRAGRREVGEPQLKATETQTRVLAAQAGGTATRVLDREGRVLCPHCGHASSASRTTCKSCHQPLPARA